MSQEKDQADFVTSLDTTGNAFQKVKHLQKKDTKAQYYSPGWGRESFAH